jgi:hypothetical protein
MMRRKRIKSNISIAQSKLPIHAVLRSLWSLLHEAFGRGEDHAVLESQRPEAIA